ncbi:hypothetical protein LEP3755_52680 [Leptolyngbya sp. NIES-3755]|nr:hypothetical protein LEP3755_52680 [Leptolyngbya sp. NIES-3755]
MMQPELPPNLNGEDIIQFYQSGLGSPPEMMKLNRFQDVINSILRSSELNDTIASALAEADVNTFTWERAHHWFKDGVGCELLKLGDARWRSGKIRMQVTLEFVPDEVASEQMSQESCDVSPLAEIRQEISSQGLNV